MAFLTALLLAGQCFMQADTAVRTQTERDTSRRATEVRQVPAEGFMKTQVVHVSEFIQRFNGALPPDTAARRDTSARRAERVSGEARRARIAQLFDPEVQPEGTSRQEYGQRMSQFVDEVCDTLDPVLLTHPPAGMFAKVTLWVNYQSKKRPVLFYMQYMPQGKGYTWQLLVGSRDG